MGDTELVIDFDVEYMPASDPKSVIEIRFNTPEEKKHYQSKVSEKSSFGFAKWGAQLVRGHFKGESTSHS